MAVAKVENAKFQVVLYQKNPLGIAKLGKLVAMLRGPAEDLVRKGSAFKALALRAEDFVGNTCAVVALLDQHPELMQRPVLVRGKSAIIGRPKEEIAGFLRGE